MPKLDRTLLTEVAETIINGGTALFLTPGLALIPSSPEDPPGGTSRQQYADRVAEGFRKAFVEKAMEMRHCSEGTAKKLLRESKNPSFIQMVGRETGWAFFHPNEDIQPHEEIGNPSFVYWPTEGGDYQKIGYLLWRRERNRYVWRPVHLNGSLLWEEAASFHEPRDAWSALLDDDPL